MENLKIVIESKLRGLNKGLVHAINEQEILIQEMRKTTGVSFMSNQAGKIEKAMLNIEKIESQIDLLNDILNQ